ncbi:MAG: hypothetical protein M1602_05205 [Firmicutes bacterium]|nr:hypothetical protein [Bacillota bacterium]
MGTVNWWVKGRSKTVFILTVVTILSAFLASSALAGSPAPVVLDGTVAASPGVNARGSTAEHYWGSGSWQAIPDTKMELYIDPTKSPFDTLGSFTVGDIASISYVTKNAGTTANVDFALEIYTAPVTDGDDTWYGHRLTAEPLYSNNYNVPKNTWNTWRTESGTNQLVFYDSNHGPVGIYGGPTLTVLQNGTVDWSVYGGEKTNIDYGNEPVQYIKLGTSTGGNWAGFNGFLDAITITLKSGTSVGIDLEGPPSTVYVRPTGNDANDGKANDNAHAKQTIQAAVGAVADGGTVYVAEGTYNEDITINKSVKLLSVAGKDSTTINGQSTGWVGAIKVAASNVTIGETGHGFTVKGAGAAAVYLAGNIEGVKLQDNSLVAAQGKNALLAEGGQKNHTIDHNTFSGNASQLVYINGQASVGNA